MTELSVPQICVIISNPIDIKKITCSIDSFLKRWIRTLSAIFLGMAIGVVGHTAHAQDNAAAGAATATSLTASYQKNQDQCPNYLAALWCSGVLVKDAKDADPLIAGKTVYLSKVLAHSAQNFSNAEEMQGGLAFTLPGAPASAGHLKPYCAIPYLTSISGHVAHGCWGSGGEIHDTDTDPSSCAASDITTSEKWIAAYRNGIASGCSFSVTIGAQFAEAMKANNVQLENSSLQIVMPDWTSDDLPKVMNAAWVYEKGKDSGRARAISNRAKAIDSYKFDAPVLAFDAQQGAFEYIAKDNEKLLDPVVETAEQKLIESYKKSASVHLCYNQDLNQQRKFFEPVNDGKGGLTYLYCETVGYKKDGTMPFYDSQTFPKIAEHPYYGVITVAGNVTAIFYMGKTVQQKMEGMGYAQQLQAFYLSRPQSSSNSIPIFSIDASPSHANYYVFSWGDAAKSPFAAAVKVVKNLNDRFESKVADCGENKSAIYCSGVIMHAAGADYNPWDYPPRRNGAGISFFYYRSDAVGDNFDIAWAGNQGMIFKSMDDQRLSNQKVDVACLYPADADTNYDIAASVSLYNKAAALCQPDASHSFNVAHLTQEFNTPMVFADDPSSCQYSKRMLAAVGAFHEASAQSLFEAWRDTQSHVIDGHYRCSFSIKSANEFLAGIKASTLHYYLTWNELMIRSYPKSTGEDVKKLPIEAFFYRKGTDPKVALQWQSNYKEITHVSDDAIPPVVEVNFDKKTNDNKPFTLYIHR